VALNALADREIAVRGVKKGTYTLETVTRYCAHLREISAGRGGDAGADARARLGQAQATLAEVNAKQLAGQLIDATEVEAFWRSKLKWSARLLHSAKPRGTSEAIKDITPPLQSLAAASNCGTQRLVFELEGWGHDGSPEGTLISGYIGRFAFLRRSRKVLPEERRRHGY